LQFPAAIVRRPAAISHARQFRTEREPHDIVNLFPVLLAAGAASSGRA
jgi:hypothetical protein